MMRPIVQDVQPRGIASYYVVAPFDEGKLALESQGGHIISLEEDARLRVQEGAKSDVSRNGNWTREGVLYVPNKGVFLTKKSPIMANAKKATACHRNGKRFYLTDKQVEEALLDSIALSNESIPAKRFGENEAAVYVFGDVAQIYGDFLAENRIKEMPVYLANLENKPFVNPMWLSGLAGRSQLSGSDRDLDGSSRLRGVREGAEGTQRNSGVGIYSDENIKRALEDLGFSGLKEGLISRLKNCRDH